MLWSHVTVCKQTIILIIRIKNNSYYNPYNFMEIICIW